MKIRFHLSTACVVSLLLVLVHHARAATWYVKTNGSDAAAGTNWATARQTIQAAIDLATANDTVLVSNGTYSAGGRAVLGGTTTNRVAITNAITVRSLNGPSVTIIKGGGSSGNTAIRCVYAGTNAVLSGFMLTNGHARTTGSTNFDRSGGGVWCESSAVVSNCIITGNSVTNFGGGAYGGTLLNCTLTGNAAGFAGGGSYGGTLRSCTLIRNSSFDGGGAFGSTLTNCTLNANSAKDNGGGAYAGTLDNCTLGTNTASQMGGGSATGVLNNCILFRNSATAGGGGAYGGILNNCTLTRNSTPADGGGANGGTLNGCTLGGNTASNIGGGAAYATLNRCTLTTNIASQLGGGSALGILNNCILTRNTATQIGGGSEGDTLNNCTLTGNSAGTGGGAMFSTLNNCIVYYNSAPSGPNTQSSILNYCCTPDPGSSGSITNPPLFIATNNFRLAPGSPCIDIGANASAPGATDLDGKPRIVNTTVDIGAYEYQWTDPGDTDHDGIPDAWESLHGLNPAVSNAPAANADADWLTDFQEYIADTGPTDPASFFPFVTATPPPEPGLLTIVIDPTSTARVYAVYSTTNLLEAPPSWIQYAPGQTGSGSALFFTVTNDPPSRVYRTGVQLP